MRYKILAGMILLLGGGCCASILLERAANRSEPLGKVTSPPIASTSRPNNPKFRGGALERCYGAFRYPDGGDGGDGGNKTMTAECEGEGRDGGLSELQFHLSKAIDESPCEQARADAGWVDWRPYPFWTVTNDDNKNMCEGATYNATVNEIDDRCKSEDIDDLNGKAMVVPGYWDDKGDFHGDENTYTISCVSGAVAKCVLWGYPPKNHYKADGGDETSLLGYYRACVRALRAGYSNEEKYKSFTCNGAIIDIYDKLGIQTMSDAGPKLDPRGLPMSCESTWSGDDTSDSLDSLVRPRYDFFNDGGALDKIGVNITPDGGCDGGLLGIRSFQQKAPACEQPMTIGWGDRCVVGVPPKGEWKARVWAVEASLSCSGANQFSLLNGLDYYQFQVRMKADRTEYVKCLAVAPSVKSGAEIIAKPCDAKKDQQFTMNRATDAGDDVYQLIYKSKESRYCLGVEENDAGESPPIVLQECAKAEHRQQFKFVF